jgi:signal transduction histidine kinase
MLPFQLTLCSNWLRKHQLVGVRDNLQRIQSLYRGFLARIVRSTAPPLWIGVAVAAALIGAEVVLVLWLHRVAPQNAYGALFLLGVLVVSAAWDFGLAAATSVASALMYVFFHEDSLGPALFVFLCLALLANVLAGQARLHAAEAEQRRVEANLAAELARTTLQAQDLNSALAVAGHRVAQVISLAFADLILFESRGDDSRLAIPLRDGEEQLGTLVVPANLSGRQQVRVQRMTPSLEALVGATRDRLKINAEVSALGRQQAALRRVATLVARGAAPDDVYLVAVAELANGPDVEHATLIEYDGHEGVVLAVCDTTGWAATMVVGERFPLDGFTISADVLRMCEPACVEDCSGACPIAQRIRGLGLRSGVGAPVVVDGQVRGVLIAGSATVESMPPGYEVHVGDFADLVATAISNAEIKAEVQASRARIVAAADQARRGFERDLHDGAQQRLVKLGLDLRALEASVPAQNREAVNRALETLMSAHADLRELSRGMHPAVLSNGGLDVAIKALARRSAVPTSVKIDVGRRLAESVEAAAYYVVAEALTNTAKHGRASEVHVSAFVDEGHLQVSVSDDGVGGAVLGGGSGLIGLKDRVEAVSGKLTVSSPVDQGTNLTVTIPVD